MTDIRYTRCNLFIIIVDGKCNVFFKSLLKLRKLSSHFDDKIIPVFYKIVVWGLEVRYHYADD